MPASLLRVFRVPFCVVATCVWAADLRQDLHALFGFLSMDAFSKSPSPFFIIAVFLLASPLPSSGTDAPSAFSGQVVFLDGTPAPGLQVALFDLSRLDRPSLTVTDDDGHFIIPLSSRPAEAADFRLGANYPNPFNPQTAIPFAVAAAVEVRLEVFNLLGQRVRTLADGARSAGVHSVTWDGRDDLGRSVAAGLYIYRISVDGHSRTGRMVLLDKRATSLPSSVPFVLAGAPRAEATDGGAVAGYGVTISGYGIETFVLPRLDLHGGVSPSFDVVRSAAEAVGSASWRPAAKVAATDGILGDVNGDGRSNISDALIVATYGLSGSVILPEGGDISLGDVNLDGRIDISDALIIATFAINPSNLYLPEGIGEPIAPPPITSTLFGFVRNRVGEPLQSAVIRLGGSLVTTTDANGCPGIEADIGTTFSVELAGFSPYLAELSFSVEDLSYSVELDPVNLPVARAAADEVLVNVGDSVTLRAGNSVDPSQRGLAFTWSSVATNPIGVEFPANNSSNEAFAVSVTLPQPGEYRFRLVVDNGLAVSDADTTLITANAFPTAVIQAPPAPLFITSGEVVELKGEGDDLEDGRLVGGAVSWFSDLGRPSRQRHRGHGGSPLGRHALHHADRDRCLRRGRYHHSHGHRGEWSADHRGRFR